MRTRGLKQCCLTDFDRLLNIIGSAAENLVTVAIPQNHTKSYPGGEVDSRMKHSTSKILKPRFVPYCFDLAKTYTSLARDVSPPQRKVKWVKLDKACAWLAQMEAGLTYAAFLHH